MSDARILVDRWGLDDVELHFTSKFGQIFLAHRKGIPVVLKIPNRDLIEPQVGAALLHFSGFGSVRLLAEHELGFLLERVRPGEPLSTYVYGDKDDEATASLIAVAAELHKAGPGEGFPPIPDWHDRFDAYSRFEGDLRLPSTRFARAKGLYLELALSQNRRQTLLHGDLHHDNILSCANRGWVAIDAKGFIGEREYEFGALLRNPGKDPRHFADQAIAARRLDIIVERTGLDRQRLLLWAFAQAVLSAVWSLEAGDDATRGLASAEALEALL